MILRFCVLILVLSATFHSVAGAQVYRYVDEYDIEKDPQGKRDYVRLHGCGVPIILVGDQRMNGFDIARFQRLYTADN